MTNQELEWWQELQELLGDACDPTFVPVYHASWSDYEEHGLVFILEKEGMFYELVGGHSVMSGDYGDVWDPEPISDQAICETINEWEEIQGSPRNLC